MAKHESGRKKKDSGRAERRTPSGKARAAEKDEFVGADDPAALLLDQAVKSTPWWMVSLAFHGLVLACLPLIIFVQSKRFDEGSTVVIKFKAEKIAKVDLGERPRGVMERAGIVADEKAATDQPKIFFPDAEDSDHIETADGEKYGQAKGDSLEALAHLAGSDPGGVKGRQPGGPGVNDVMGPGGGSGGAGRYGGRLGGEKNRRVKDGGGTTATESAVSVGLAWLARHQSPDGHWDASGFAPHCDCAKKMNAGLNDFDTGVTGLALLAFLGAGWTPQNRSTCVDTVTGQTVRYGEVVRNGLRWLIDQQDKDGAVGPHLREMMYNHSIAALALSEAYGITNAVTYRAPAQKAIDFLQAAQNPYLAWRYTPRCNDNDTSVTGWCVMALKSAQISGLAVGQTSFEGAKAWLDRVTDANGQVGYDRLGSGEVFLPGVNDQWQHHQSMTAVGLLCRIFIDKKKGDPRMAKAASILTQDLPKWDANAAKPTIDYYYWYYGTLALFQFDGPTGASWRKWNTCMADTLCKNQHVRKDGCLDGSWDVNVDRWTKRGGRVCGTAMNILTLEVYYRYASVFGSEKRQ
jgi:hypothetical protein